MLVVRENELARQTGRFVARLAFRRIARCRWMARSWPAMSILRLQPENRQKAMVGLRADLRNLEELEKHVAESMPFQEHLERSVFKAVPAQQLAHGLREGGFEPSPRALVILGRRHTRLLGSQVCEGAVRQRRLVEKQP